MLELHINLSQLRHNKNDIITGTLQCYNKFHLWNSCLLLTNCCSGKKDSCLSNVMEWFPALLITCKLMTEAVDFSSLHGFFPFMFSACVLYSSWFFPFLYVYCLCSLVFMGYFPFFLFFSLHGLFPFLYVFCLCSLALMGYFPFFYVFCLCSVVFMGYFPFFVFSACVLLWCCDLTHHVTTSFFFKSRSLGFLQMACVQTEVSVTQGFWLDVFWSTYFADLCSYTYMYLYFFSQSFLLCL